MISRMLFVVALGAFLVFLLQSHVSVAQQQTVSGKLTPIDPLSHFPEVPPPAVELVVGGLTPINPVASAPFCGGAGQPRCPARPATPIGKSRNSCTEGFFDLTTWACWSCPAGYVRSAEPVIGERACSKVDTSQKVSRVAAEFVGPRCPSGSFFDPIRGGECWSCPKDYTRSAAHVEASNACFIKGGEQFSGATKLRATIWPHECKSGSFWDGYNGGACYTCPGGYRRTAHHITDSKACSQAVAERQSVATLVKAAQCEAGTIYDPRNGGECWQCPASSLRTVFPINEGAACEYTALHVFKAAKRTAPLTCEPGQIFDLGVCYKCPDGYDRSQTHITSSDACKTDSIVWKTAPYTEPGLFGFDGAGDVLYQALRNNPKLVQETLKTVAAERARVEGEPLASVLAAERQQLIGVPQKSVVAHAIVLARIIAAATEPVRASPAEVRLVAAFKRYVIAKRTYIAQDMLAAYDAWYAADQYWRNQRNLDRGLAGLMYYGTVPPSFDKLSMAAATGINAAATATSMSIDAITNVAQVSKAAQRLNLIGDALGIVLAASGAGWTPSTNPEQIALSVTRSLGEVAVSQAIGQLLTVLAQVPAWTVVAGGTATSVSMAALSTTGPQLIVTGGMILAGIAIDQVVSITEARPKLLSSITFAKADPDLARMLKTKIGVGELENHWTTASDGGPTPSPAYMNVYKRLAYLASQP